MDLEIDRLLHPASGQLRVLDATTLGRLTRELLPGWYEEWVLVERERIRQRSLHALEFIGRAHLRCGDALQAIEAALAAVAVEPLRESPRRLLVEAHLAEGNTSEAIREYEQFRTLLEAELGLLPTPEFTDLLQTPR